MSPSRSPITLPLLVLLAVVGAVVAACGSSKKATPAETPPPPPPCAQVADCPAVACQVASCTGGACAYVDAAVSTTCDDGQGGRFCDEAGACVGCLDVADCGTTDACTLSLACVNHTCERRFVPGGLPPENVPQRPNDCVTAYCDQDRGLVLNFTPTDVVTVTANPCTQVVCYVAGTDPLVAATLEQALLGTACPGGVCDPAGVCSTVP